MIIISYLKEYNNFKKKKKISTLNNPTNVVMLENQPTSFANT